MSLISRLPLVVLAIASVQCGGGGKSSTPVSPTPTTPTTVTVTTVAPSLGAEINSSFKAAMRAGSPVASRERISTRQLLAALIEQFLGVPVHAQSGFVANCSSGGTVRIGSFGPSPGGGRVQLSNTPVTYSGCAHSLNGRIITANGTLTGNGTWTATAPDSPVRLSGDLAVSDVGTIRIEGTTGVLFGGAIGGISVGNPDTPPPPNPTTTTSTTTTTVATTTIPGTTTTIPSSTTSVATTTTTTSVASTTTTTAPPTPGAINVTGLWSGGLSLTQSGSSISGSVVGLPPTPGATVVTNSITGTIVGNSVNLTAVYAVRTTADTATITATATSQYSLQAASSSLMSGTVSGSVVTICVGSQYCPPSSTTPIASSSVTLTK